MRDTPLRVLERTRSALISQTVRPKVLCQQSSTRFLKARSARAVRHRAHFIGNRMAGLPFAGIVVRPIAPSAQSLCLRPDPRQIPTSRVLARLFRTAPFLSNSHWIRETHSRMFRPTCSNCSWESSGYTGSASTSLAAASDSGKSPSWYPTSRKHSCKCRGTG